MSVLVADVAGQLLAIVGLLWILLVAVPAGGSTDELQAGAWCQKHVEQNIE